MEEQREPLARVRPALVGRVERGGDEVAAEAEELREQIALRGEVVEEGLARDVRALADVGHLGRLEADLAEQLHRGLEDPRARLLLAAVAARAGLTGH